MPIFFILPIPETNRSQTSKLICPARVATVMFLLNSKFRSYQIRFTREVLKGLCFFSGMIVGVDFNVAMRQIASENLGRFPTGAQ
jgi:hypothetical protein